MSSNSLVWKDEEEINLKITFDAIKSQLANKSAEKIALKLIVLGSDPISFVFLNGNDRDVVINAIKFGMAQSMAAATPTTTTTTQQLSAQEAQARQKLLASNTEWKSLVDYFVLILASRIGCCNKSIVRGRILGE